MKSLLWLILFLASSTSWAWPPLTNTPTNTLTPFNSAPSSATPTPIIINPTRTATPLAVSVPGGVYLASPPPTSTPTITQTPTQTTTTLPSATATVTSTPTSTATPSNIQISGPITYSSTTALLITPPFSVIYSTSINLVISDASGPVDDEFYLQNSTNGVYGSGQQFNTIDSLNVTLSSLPITESYFQTVANTYPHGCPGKYWFLLNHNLLGSSPTIVWNVTWVGTNNPLTELNTPPVNFYAQFKTPKTWIDSVIAFLHNEFFPSTT